MTTPENASIQRLLKASNSLLDDAYRYPSSDLYSISPEFILEFRCAFYEFEQRLDRGEIKITESKGE